MTDEEAARGGALLAYAYASLAPVLEGWDHLKLRDERVDALVYEPSGEPHRYWVLLRRFRNAAFHYQLNTDDERFDGLMLEHDALVWAGELRRELVKFFADREENRTMLEPWLMAGSPPWFHPDS